MDWFDECNISRGVPRTSILGPILYLDHIRDAGIVSAIDKYGTVYLWWNQNAKVKFNWMFKITLEVDLTRYDI
jgi:hypothetical protein